MRGFPRQDRFLSLCGLNCGLCTMNLGAAAPAAAAELLKSAADEQSIELKLRKKK